MPNAKFVSSGVSILSSHTGGNVLRDRQHRFGNDFPIEPTGPIAGVSDGVRPAPSMGHQWLMTSLLNQVSIAQALSGPLHKR